MYRQIEPVIDYSVRGLCSRPYEGHKKGCPNFGDPTKLRCPPQAPKIEDVIDLEKPIFAIYNRFDFAAHVARMYETKPGRTKRQAECCLYWQGTARKQLKGEIALFKQKHPADWWISTTPEACGINVTATMKSIRVELEWPPVNFTYQVALAGTPLEG